MKEPAGPPEGVRRGILFDVGRRVDDDMEILTAFDKSIRSGKLCYDPERHVGCADAVAVLAWVGRVPR